MNHEPYLAGVQFGLMIGALATFAAAIIILALIDILRPADAASDADCHPFDPRQH